jgi:ribosomal protein S12
MPTIQQLVRSRRIQIKKKTKSPALVNCPQRRGFVRVFIQQHLKNQIRQFEKWHG